MFESHYPTTQELAEDQRARRIGLWLLFLLASLVIFGLLAMLINNTELPAGTIGFLCLGVFLCLAMPVVIWNNPRLGFYIFITGAMIIEEIPNAHLPTSMIPFLQSLSTFGSSYGYAFLEPLKFSIAELVIIVTFLAWLVRSVAMRQLRIVPGAFIWGMLAYMLAIAWGWFHGITSGGDRTMALWEVRAQGHFFIAYLMAANLITERRHVYPVLWATVIGIGIKAMLGTFIYAGQGFHSSTDGIMLHEESLLVNMIFFVLFISWIGGVDKKLTAAAMFLTPFALITELANQRRAGIAAFIIAFIPLVPILWFSMRERRKQIATFAVIFGCLSMIYLPLAWNASGAWALPARAIKSNRSPSERDNASNTYRMSEEYNIKATRDLDPWRGIGYGKRFGMYIALPQVTTDFMFFMPHNSVMWVWMRIGHIGFFCFMMMIAVCLIRGTQYLKETQDPLLQMTGVLGLMCLLMIFTFGKYDQSLINYRVMIMTGGYLGILSVLRRLDPAAPQPADETAQIEA